MKRTILTLILNLALLLSSGCAAHHYRAPDGATLTSGSLLMKRATVDLQRSTNGAVRARINGSQTDTEALSAVTAAAVGAAVKGVVP